MRGKSLEIVYAQFFVSLFQKGVIKAEILCSFSVYGAEVKSMVLYYIYYRK